jgi:membrane protein implicated in regulation of membrane protease activity
MRGLNPRAAVISAAILGALVAISALLWSYPRVLLYVLLGLFAVMAYAALYLIIASSKARDDRNDAPPTDPDDPATR